MAKQSHVANPPSRKATEGQGAKRDKKKPKITPAQKKSEMAKLKKAIEKQTGGKVKIKQVKMSPKRIVIWLLIIFFVAPFFISMF